MRARPALKLGSEIDAVMAYEDIACGYNVHHSTISRLVT
jgi:hypothetical protein